MVFISMTALENLSRCHTGKRYLSCTYVKHQSTMYNQDLIRGLLLDISEAQLRYQTEEAFQTFETGTQHRPYGRLKT